MYKKIGMMNSMPLYSRLGGTSQVEGWIRSSEKSSRNAGPELMDAELSLFFNSLNVRTHVKNDFSSLLDTMVTMILRSYKSFTILCTRSITQTGTRQFEIMSPIKTKHSESSQ
jgi:hypothetical protein